MGGKRRKQNAIVLKASKKMMNKGATAFIKLKKQTKQ
jgi:hypothetical protein